MFITFQPGLDKLTQIQGAWRNCQELIVSSRPFPSLLLGATSNLLNGREIHITESLCTKTPKFYKSRCIKYSKLGPFVLIIIKSFILLYVHQLLGNELVNKFPRRQILSEQSVARSRNNRGSCVAVSAMTSLQWIVITWHVFSVDPTDAPISWLDSDHMICVYCGSMSVPVLYK
jgi:hypothetical protein